MDANHVSENTLHSATEITSVRRLTEWHSSFTFFVYEEVAHNFHHSVAEVYPVSL